MPAKKMKSENAAYLFESSWHKKYTPRGIQKMFKRYVVEAEISGSLTPHKMRHYLFRWLKTQGIDDGFEFQKDLEQRRSAMA